MTLVLVLSCLGFVAGLTIHLLVIAGVATIPLSIAFGVFFPAMVGAVLANMHVIAQRHQDYAWLPRGDFWKFLSQNAPPWMQTLQIFLLVYAVFNFYFAMLVINQGAYPRIVDGAYVLERHKLIIAHLTAQQYWWHAEYVVRVLSSMVAAVYFAAVTRWVARWRTVGAERSQALPEEAAG